jgi:hypothetical protein
MPTPTGTISMSDVNTELGRSATASINLNEAAVRSLAGVASGTISMNDLRGKSNVTFSPDGGTSAGTAVLIYDFVLDGGVVSTTIDCSVNAVWTYTRSGSFGTPTTGSNTATSRSFTLINTTTSFRSTTWTVSATAGGITRYWNVQLENEGYA